MIFWCNRYGVFLSVGTADLSLHKGFPCARFYHPPWPTLYSVPIQHRTISFISVPYVLLFFPLVTSPLSSLKFFHLCYPYASPAVPPTFLHTSDFTHLPALARPPLAFADIRCREVHYRARIAWISICLAAESALRSVRQRSGIAYRYISSGSGKQGEGAKRGKGAVWRDGKGERWDKESYGDSNFCLSIKRWSLLPLSTYCMVNTEWSFQRWIMWQRGKRFYNSLD